jgi:hypothetical protein
VIEPGYFVEEVIHLDGSTSTYSSPCDCLCNVTDCAGVCGGTAYYDHCSRCVGGNTGLDACIQDCMGAYGINGSLTVVTSDYDSSVKWWTGPQHLPQ